MLDSLETMTDLNLTDTASDPFAGPAWDNTTEYPALDAAELEADYKQVEELLAGVAPRKTELEPYVARAAELEIGDSDKAVALP